MLTDNGTGSNTTIDYSTLLNKAKTSTGVRRRL